MTQEDPTSISDPRNSFRMQDTYVAQYEALVTKQSATPCPYTRDQAVPYSFPADICEDQGMRTANLQQSSGMASHFRSQVVSSLTSWQHGMEDPGPGGYPHGSVRPGSSSPFEQSWRFGNFLVDAFALCSEMRGQGGTWQICNARTRQKMLSDAAAILCSLSCSWMTAI